MTNAQPDQQGDSPTAAPMVDHVHDEEYLAARCMFPKEYDLLDIDHGHFWYKLSWHGVHVEFPSPQHHYEANPFERRIRDYLLSLPVEVLDGQFARLQEAPEIEFEHGDHHFRMLWDDEVRRHIHCYYQRSEAGKAHDRAAYRERLQAHVTAYDHDRKFPSRRLSQRLEWLREERAKAQQAVDAWDRLIAQVEAQMAHDELLHIGPRESAAAAI